MPKKYFPKKWKILQKLRPPTTPSRIKNFYTDGKNLQLSGGLEGILKEVLVKEFACCKLLPYYVKSRLFGP